MALCKQWWEFSLQHTFSKALQIVWKQHQMPYLLAGLYIFWMFSHLHPTPSQATAFNWIPAWSWHTFKWICKWAGVPIPSSVPQPGPPWHSYGGQMVTAYRCPLSQMWEYLPLEKHIPAHKAKESSWGWATWKKWQNGPICEAVGASMIKPLCCFF